MRRPEGLDRIADPNQPLSLDLRVHPEGKASPAADPGPLACDLVQGREVLLARVRSERRHHTPRDLSVDTDDGPADANELAVPRILLVGLAPFDLEVDPEAVKSLSGYAPFYSIAVGLALREI